MAQSNRTIRFLAFGAFAASIGMLSACGGGGSGSGSAAVVPGGVAGRYLISDAYPLTATQPNHFNVACDGSAAVTSVPAVNPDGTSYLHYSVSSLSAGAHSCVVYAADASNHQSSPASLSFSL